MSATPKRRREDKMPGRIFTFFYRMFFMIGIAAFISVTFLLITLSRLTSFTPPELPDNMYLSYTFKSDLAEMVTKPSVMQPLLRPAATLHDVVSALDLAAKDDRVKGFAAKIEDINFSIAQMQELRDAVLRFRESGKFAYIYSDSIGGFSSGLADYYLASAFDQIWVQPVGVVALGGVAAETPFVKGVLDNIGVTAQFAHRGKYKSAPESLTETGMTAPHREMMESIVRDLSDQMLDGIAQTRGIDRAELQKLADGGLFSDKEALALKLIDRIGYYDEMLAAVGVEEAVPEASENIAEDETAEKEKAEAAAQEAEPVAKPQPKAVGLLGYAFVNETQSIDRGISGFLFKLLRKEAPPTAHPDKAKIGLIFASGEIVPFRPRAQASFGGTSMEANKVVAAFAEAADDPDVAAIVFRIDTPGGSPSAAESIRRAIIKAQEKGKPVVISMSSYAASGGYWLAAPADKIVAQPGTLTGSIGVFGGKFVLAGLWDKIGVKWETVSAGQNAGMWSANRPFTAAELEKFDSMLGQVYDAFLERVMEGRKMTRDQAEAVAQGRVYTGRQAQEAGLVDELGGLDRAVSVARDVAGLPADIEVPLKRFPPRKSTLEMFISLATEGALFTPHINITARDVMTVLEQSAAAQDNILMMRETSIR